MIRWNRVRSLLAAVALLLGAGVAVHAQSNPVVRFTTVLGDFSIELFPNSAPVTVQNFLNYVDRGAFENSIFHRSVQGFVVQGGGYVLSGGATLGLIQTDPPIVNEFNQSNTRGTVAMAKLGSDPNSATSQWFVNLADNGPGSPANLDAQNGGFTVFGRVTGNGMDVIDAIAALTRVDIGSGLTELPVVNWNGGSVQASNMVALTGVTRVVSQITVGAIDALAANSGESFVIEVPVTPADGPASTGISVRADLSPVGGAADTALFDDGTNGDAVAGDNTFTRSVTLPGSTAAGAHTLPITVTDAQSRTAAASATVTVSRPPGSDPFTVPDRGGVSSTPSGGGTTTVVGYGEIEPDPGRTTPAGLAIFSNTQNGVVVSEAGVPATPAVQFARIFAEVSGPVNTGLAIANPGGSVATIEFYMTDLAGESFGAGSFTLAPGAQTAVFLDQAPFNAPSPFVGTFTFASTVPIGVVALRGYTNERSEFLITTLPVIPVGPTNTSPQYLAHFADGGGWTTEVILVNPTDDPLTGQVQFFEDGDGVAAAGPATVPLADQTSGSTFPYTVPGRTALRFTTAGIAGTTQGGSVRVVPDSGSAVPAALGVFALDSGGVRISEAGVPGGSGATAYRAYVEASGGSGPINSGLAIADVSGAPNTVTLELTDLAGNVFGTPQTVTLSASGQVARFVDQFFDLPDGFAGLLRVTSTGETSMVGLRSRINARSDFLITTTPPTREQDPAPTGTVYFPHIADSGGWSTQFILFSGASGQTSAGSLGLTGQDGQPLDLN